VGVLGSLSVTDASKMLCGWPSSGRTGWCGARWVEVRGFRQTQTAFCVLYRGADGHVREPARRAVDPCQSGGIGDNIAPCLHAVSSGFEPFPVFAPGGFVAYPLSPHLELDVAGLQSVELAASPLVLRPMRSPAGAVVRFTRLSNLTVRLRAASGRNRSPSNSPRPRRGP
jgi:hypothetical protein